MADDLFPPDGGDTSGGGSDVAGEEPVGVPRRVEDEELRRRAEQAEERVLQLENELAELEQTLSETRAALDDAERRHEIDRQLVEADAVDLETARLLTEASVGQMGEGDVSEAVSELKRTKPFLFKRAARAQASAMSGALECGRCDELQDAAENARATGDRRTLLRYLRLRRTGVA